MKARRGAVDCVLTVVERVSTATGWFAGWLIVPLTLAVAYEVTARYVFNAPTKWAYHLTYMLYGAQFMLAAPHTLAQGGHIRTDMFYERWSPTTRAAVDTVFYVLFFFPGLLFVLHAGAVEARQAWEIGERLGGRPAYLFKGVIPLTAALLILQGVAEVIKCARILRGERP